jgi:hypothetical protein
MTTPRRPWSDAEDRYLWRARHAETKPLAFFLGRTQEECKQRLTELRKSQKHAELQHGRIG